VAYSGSDMPRGSGADVDAIKWDGNVGKDRERFRKLLTEHLIICMHFMHLGENVCVLVWVRVCAFNANMHNTREHERTHKCTHIHISLKSLSLSRSLSLSLFRYVFTYIHARVDSYMHTQTYTDVL